MNLKQRPKDFWKSTPVEFWSLYEEVVGEVKEPMSSGALKEMIARDKERRAKGGKNKA